MRALPGNLNYFERLDPARAKRQAIRRLEALGFSVTLAAKDTPAA